VGGVEFCFWDVTLVLRACDPLTYIFIYFLFIQIYSLFRFVISSVQLSRLLDVFFIFCCYRYLI